MKTRIVPTMSKRIIASVLFVLVLTVGVLCASVYASSVMTGFVPATHGFRFDNTFRTAPIQGSEIQTSGLCGGMVYSALDYYLQRRPIPTQDYTPANETPLRNYIYNRQIDSLIRNADKWAELGTNWLGARDSEFFRWGLQGTGGGRLQELREMIDRGTPVPLGLWPYGHGSPADYHQVLAIGYDLGRYRGDLGAYKEDLRIYIYDPNHHGVIKTFKPDLAHEGYCYDDDANGLWRTYFVDKQYEVHNPPEIGSRDLGPNDGLVRELLLEVKTGDDDLRGGNDNVNLTINYRSSSQQVPNINRGGRWIDNYQEAVSVPLRQPVPLNEIKNIVLTTTFSGGVGGDNWNMNSLKVTARGGGVNQVIYQRAGTPLFRFTGDVQTFNAPNTFYSATPPTTTPTTPPSTPSVSFERDTDRPGSDFYSTQAATADQCAALCRGNTRCRAFTHYQGNCYLKEGVPAARPLPGATSGVVPSSQQPTAVQAAPPAITIERDTDRPGSDFFNTAQPSVDACAALCQREARCRVFTYYQGNCWLKDSVSAPSPLPGAFSGVVRR